MMAPKGASGAGSADPTYLRAWSVFSPRLCALGRLWTLSTGRGVEPCLPLWMSPEPWSAGSLHASPESVPPRVVAQPAHLFSV